ncbi:MAG: hypothetical protein GY866_12190 [Proteobacteria bacterium]|nr:hypothetical protein [Pseudomonadota bacterium]
MKNRSIVIAIVMVLMLVSVACEKTDRKPEPGPTAKSSVATVKGKDYIYVPVSNALQIIDAETDTIVKTIRYDDYIIGAGFSPDGKRYYMNAFHSIYAVDTAAMELVDTYRFSSSLSKVTVSGFGISEDNRKLYISCTIVKKKQNIPKLNLLPPQLIVFDLETKNIVKSYETPYMVKSVMTIAGDPDHLILTGRDVFKMDLRTGKLDVISNMFTHKEGEYPLNYLPMAEINSPGDHNIVVYGYVTGEGLDLSIGYLFIDRNTGRARTMPGKDLWFAYTNGLSVDKKHIYSVMDELIKIDAETGKTVKFVPTETGTNYSIAFTSDGKKVYIGPGGPDVSVYDAETLKLLKVIRLEADGAVMNRITL